MAFGPLALIAWSDDASFSHTIDIGLTVLGYDELGLESVMYQLADVLNRIVDFLKQWV
jgi:hypothetical protein